MPLPSFSASALYHPCGVCAVLLDGLYIIHCGGFGIPLFCFCVGGTLLSPRALLFTSLHVFACVNTSTLISFLSYNEPWSPTSIHSCFHTLPSAGVCVSISCPQMRSPISFIPSSIPSRRVILASKCSSIVATDAIIATWSLSNRWTLMSELRRRESYSQDTAVLRFPEGDNPWGYKIIILKYIEEQTMYHKVSRRNYTSDLNLLKTSTPRPFIFSMRAAHQL